jgi:hypothetical protein
VGKKHNRFVVLSLPADNPVQRSPRLFAPAAVAAMNGDHHCVFIETHNLYCVEVDLERL